MTRRPEEDNSSDPAIPVALCLLAVLIAAVYSNTLHAGFHFDDHAAIVSDGSIMRLWKLRTILDAFNTRFLLGLSFALNYALGRYDVLGYHLLNITVHFLASTAVFFLTLQTLETPRMQPQVRSPHLAALVAAVLFAAHPVQTQAVTYIWQRGASMATFFYVASMACYARARLRSSGVFYGLSLAAAVCAMFTKEISVTLPIALTLYEACFFRQKGERFHARPLLPFWACLAIIPLMLLRQPQLTAGIMKPKMQMNGVSDSVLRWVDEDVMPQKAYRITQLNVLRTYLRLLVFPKDQNLDYDYPIATSLSSPGVGPSLCVLGALLLAAILFFRRRPFLSFGIAWFLLSLSVESLVVQNDVIFEHRLYLPMAAFSMLAAFAARLFFRKDRAFWIALLLAALSLSFAAWRRNAVWRDDITLWSDVVAKSPHKVRGYANLAFSYDQDPSGHTRALSLNRKALELDPRCAMVYFNLGVSDHKEGKNEKAIASWEKAIKLDPAMRFAYSNLANAYSEQGREEEAIRLSRRALEMDPTFVDAYVALANSYLQIQKYPEAVEVCLKASTIDPPSAENFNTLGIAYSKLGKKAEALAAFRKALDIDPGIDEAKKNMKELKNA